MENKFDFSGNIEGEEENYDGLKNLDYQIKVERVP